MGMGRTLVLVLAIQLLCPWYYFAPAALAQEAPAAEASPLDLDLSSTERTVSAAEVLPTGQATIDLAGIARTISPADMLTAAEMVAVRQVVNTGNQYLQLNDLGAAIGGGLHLQYYAANGLGNLVIPEGVRASQNAAMLQSLNLTGNLTNSGTLNIFSTDAAITSSIINANNIYNNAGALISSTLANLNLNAVNNIVNAGTIMSTGNLSMTAGGSITNSAIMQAMSNLTAQAATMVNTGTMLAQQGNINALTAQMTNSGLMQSLAGNVNIHNLLGTQLSVDGILGSISAANRINLSTLPTLKDLNGNVLSKGLISLTGNTLTGQELNFTSPEGIVNIQADRLNGPVAISAGVAYVGARQGDLFISQMNLTGDPIYYAQSGNLDLSGLFSGGSTFSTSGGDFVALASGNITATTAPGDALIDTTPNTVTGSITIIAGINFNVTGGASPISCSDCAPLYSVTGTSSSGGDISLPTVSLKSSQYGFDTNGAILLEARDDGSETKGNITINNIENLGLGNFNSTNGAYQSIQITIAADGNIVTSAIDTSGVQSTPTAVSAMSGGLGGGIILTSAYGSIDVIGDITTVGGGGGGGTTATGDGGHGGLVRITALEGNIFIDGNINTYGGGGGGGDNLAGYGGDGGGVTLMSNTGTIDVLGAVNTSGGGGGGSNTLPGQGGAAGNITMFTPNSISIDGPVLAAGGGNGGTSIGGGGGSFGGGGGAGSQASTSGSGGGTFGKGGAAGAGGGGFFGGGSGGTGTGFNSWGGSGGGTVGGQGGLTGGSQTGGDGSFGFGGNGTSAGNPGTDAGTSGGGTISLSGSVVTVNQTIGSAFGFSTSPFASYSIYAGTNGTVAISTPTAFLPDANYESGTDSTKAFLGSSSFTVGGSGSAGSINAGNGIYINRTNVGINVSSGTTAAASNSVTITENSSPLVINNGDLITPAEWVAVVQEVHGGQTATLDASGNITNGSINIGIENYPGGGFTRLIIPAGITASSDVRSTKVTGTTTLNSTLTLNGSPYGTLIAPGLTIANNTSLIAASQTLYLFLDNSLVNDGNIEGLGGIIMFRSGTLTISGDGTFTTTNPGSISFTAMGFLASQQTLTFSGNQTLNPGATGDVTSNVGNLTIDNGATLTIADGSVAVFSHSELSLEANSTITALSASTDLTIQVPLVVIEQTGLLSTAGDLTVQSLSITNSGSIRSTGNGTITLQTDNLVNDDVFSSIDAGAFGTVIINPPSTRDVMVGGTTHSGVSLDITAADMANITARNLTIGDLSSTSSLALAGNVDVSTLYNLTLLSADTFDGNSNTITLALNTLNIQASGSASTNGIFGSGSTIEITAGGTLTVNDSIQATDPNNAFSINGTIILQGSPVILNLGVGEELNAGQQTGVVTINPSTAMNVLLNAASHSGSTFDITSADLEVVDSRTLNIGDNLNTTNITLQNNLNLNSSMEFSRLNLITQGAYNYNGNSLDWNNKSGSVTAGGNIDLGPMTNGGNYFTGQAGGMLNLNGAVAGFADVTLSGSPVMFNGNSINAFDVVTLKPSSALAVNVGGLVESGSTFDITAGDLANITAATVIIGDEVNATGSTVQGNLDISGPSGTAGNYNLTMITAGNFTSTGYSITLGRTPIDNSSTLTISAYGSVSVDDITSITNVGAIALITAGGTLSLAGNINVSGGTANGRIELRGSPVQLTTYSLNAGTSGFVALAPTSDTTVAIADALGTAAPFDVSASNLANITAGTLQVGDIFHTLTLSVEGNMDISGTGLNYNLVLISATSVDRTGRTITIGTNNLAISTNGGLNNLATGDLDVAYLFDGNANWRPDANGSLQNFVLNTGGSSSSSVNGTIDTGLDGGNISILAGGAYSYTALGGIITFTGPGTSATGGAVSLSNVNFETNSGNISVDARGSVLGSAGVGAVSATGTTGTVTITADTSASAGAASVSRITGNLTLSATGYVQTNGSIYANNITIEATANDGGVFLTDSNLYAGNTIDISSNGAGLINISSGGGLVYIEAPTINITTSSDPTTGITIGQDVQIVTPVTIGSAGAITITSSSVSNNGLIAALGNNATLTIQAPGTNDLTISTFDRGRLVADPLSGLITISSASGQVGVTQFEISGKVAGSSSLAFSLTTTSGLLTLGNIQSANTTISITSASDIHVAPGSTIQAAGNIGFTSTIATSSMLISGTNITSTGGNVHFNDFNYVKNDSTISAGGDVLLQHSGLDLIVTGSGSLEGNTIIFDSNQGSVIATQDHIIGTVNVTAYSLLFLSILNASVGFVPGTMTSTSYGAASVPSGFTDLYISAPAPLTLSNNVIGITTGSFSTFTITSGTLTVAGNGNMIVAIRGDAGITSIDGIATSGGNLYFDTTLVAGLTFTGGLDTRASSGKGGYIVLNSAGTIDTQDIFTNGVTSGKGGAVTLTAADDITVNGFIDAPGVNTAAGGSVIITSAGGNVTIDSSINTIGGSASDSTGTGGNITIGAGLAINIVGFLDSSAESSVTTGSLAHAGWILLSATSISSGSIRANGGASGSSANQGNGGSITLAAGSISVGAFIDSAGKGGGYGGDVTIRAGNAISVVSVNATGGAQAFSSEIDGGFIVIQSNTSTITATSFLDSSASYFADLDGGGNAGMIFVVAPTNISGSMSFRAEGRSKPGNESSDLLGDGNNITIQTNGTATIGFVSSSEQSTVATRYGGAANAGRIDVIANTGVNASTFRSNGGIGGGNGGDINITSSTGNVTTSFLFTTALGNDYFDGTAVGDGGDINISAPAGTISINSFIDTSGSANYGNGGSVKIRSSNGITSNSYIAANGATTSGNGGNIYLQTTSAGSDINFTFSLDSAARGGGNGGNIFVNAIENIQTTTISAQGGTRYGHGGEIFVVAATNSMQIGPVNSRSGHDGLIGTSRAGDIFLQSGNGNIVVQGDITAGAEGISGNAGDVTIGYDNAGATFVIDSTNGALTNGVVGSIYAQANGSGNGGAVSIFNGTGNLAVNLNSLIDVRSTSGSAGSINFNYQQSGIVLSSNPASSVTVTGNSSGELLGPAFASGTSVNINLSATTSLSLGNITATAGSINTTLGQSGQILSILSGYLLQASEGNITLQNSNTTTGSILLGTNSTLAATTTGTTLGRVYVVIGSPPGSPVVGTPPANLVVDEQNGGQVYFGTDSITANAPNNFTNADGSEIVFNTNSLGASAITLGGNVTINATAATTGGGPIFSLDFTDPTLTALILSLQGSSDVGGTLNVNGQGVATGGNAIIGSNMLANTLTSAYIPSGVTVTFDGFTASDEINVDITEDSYSNVAIIAGTLQFDTTGSPSGGLITINSDQAAQWGNPAFVLTGTGQLLSDGSLSLSASGNMLLQGTLTAATNLTLATTANNGNINITGSVTATNSATLSTNGNGTVTGTIDTPTLNFSSTMGNLGTSGSRFVTTSDSLGISTGGDAYINNTSTGTLSLGATSARNFDLINDHAVTLSSTLQASQSASILVTGNNGGVTLNGNFTAPNWVDMVANGSGDIVQNGGSIRTSSVYLKSGSGNIGSSGSPIQTSAFYTTFITSGGEVHLNSSNSIRVHNPSSGSTIDITSNGQIEVAQPITSTGSVTFNGAGSIILSADITATSFVSLYGNGHGNILNNGGSVITPTISTSTGSGSIGTDSNPINTTADDITASNQSDVHIATSSTPTNFNVSANYVSLTLNITGDLGSSGSPFATSVNQLALNVLGAAYVNNSSSLTLGNSTVRDTVQISANGNLTVNDLVTTTGSISLTAQSGALTINPGSTVQANEGNLTLTNNSSTGSIFVGSGATVKGFTVSNPSFGNVSMTVGASAGTTGSAPGNVTENIVADGQIIIGINSFTSNNSGNTLDALDRTITIDAGATGSITLDGNVLISADPPMPQVTAPTSIANILPLLSVTSSSNTSTTQLGTTNFMIQPVVLDSTLITRPLNINTDQYQLINLNSAPVDNNSAPDEPVYKPIAYTTTSAPSASTIVNSSRELSHADFGSCLVRHAGADVSYNESGSVNLNSGEVLIHSPRHTVVKSGDYSISIDPGSVALITKEGSVVKVRALHESHTNAIVITAGNNPIKLSVGQEVMLAPNSTHLQKASQDNLGRRHVVDAQLPNGHAMSRSEFSHMTLIEQSHVLTKLVQSKSPSDKQLADKLVKTAACLMTVTGAHGAFTGK